MDAVEDECAHIEAQSIWWAGRVRWILPFVWVGLIFTGARVALPVMLPVVLFLSFSGGTGLQRARTRFRVLLNKVVIPQLVEALHPQWRYKVHHATTYLTATASDRVALEVIVGRVRIMDVQYELVGAYKGRKMRWHKISAAYRDTRGISQFFRGALVRLELAAERPNRILVLPRDTPNVAVHSTHLFGLHQGAFYKVEAQEEAFGRHYQVYATVGDESVVSEALEVALAAFAERHGVAMYGLLVGRYLYVAVDLGTSLKLPTYEERETLAQWVTALHGELNVVRDGLAAWSKGGAMG